MGFPDDSATGGPQDEVMAAQFDHQRWEQLRRDQLGIGVVDPLGDQIGKAAANRYEPVDGLKHVLVGEFDQVAAGMDDRGDVQKRQRGPGFCVECEITPEFLLMLQDDSGRFDRPDHYNGPVPRPWSAFPRRANIMVALQPQRQKHNHYELMLLRTREVHDWRDPGDVSTTELFNGQPVTQSEK
jgi:hypothetical protein